MSEGIESLQAGIVGAYVIYAYQLADLDRMARMSGLKAEHFTEPELHTAYDIIQGLHTTDKNMVMCALMDKFGQEKVLGWMDKAGVTLSECGTHMQKVANKGLMGKIAKVFRDLDQGVMKYNVDGKSMIDDFIAQLSHLRRCETGEVEKPDEGVMLCDLADPIPEADDPDALFKNRWFNKGHAMFLTSVSGSGKSIITMQLAYAWARGQAIFGIQPLRPLKIAIFQTEDDEEELKDFRDSMRRGFQEVYHWTELETAQSERNIFFYDTKGKTGADFAQRLREVQLKAQADMVIINPFQAVTGFDISKNAELTKFLREDLDPVIKDNATKCGLFIVHHTNKPPAAQNRAGFGTDQYAEYVGAGGAELVNWMRGMLAIMPTADKGVYKFVAGKRGKRLEWPVIPGEKSPNPVRYIRHSDSVTERMLFWREVENSSTAAGSEGSVPTKVPTVLDDAIRLANDLRKLPRTLTETRAYAKELLGRKRGEMAYDKLVGKLDDFMLVIKQSGISTQSFIGTEEGVENAISTAREKRAQEMLAKLHKNVQ